MTLEQCDFIGSKIGLSALNNVRTGRKGCQECALCGTPLPKWPSIPKDAALSNISRWDVMEKCMTFFCEAERGGFDLWRPVTEQNNDIYKKILMWKYEFVI